MIARLSAGQHDLFLSVLRQHPFLGSRIRSAYICYGIHSPLAGFYFVGKSAAVAVLGNSALVAGQAEPQELGLFLQLQGVNNVKTTGMQVEGYSPIPQYLMERKAGCTDGTQNRILPVGCDLHRNPDLWQLAHSGLLPDAESYYGDALHRKNKGLADIAAVWCNGEYVSTAGLYSIQPEGGYITAVATKPSFQKQGLAGSLLSYFADKYRHKTLWLLCRPQLKPYYQHFGFVAGAPVQELVLNTVK